MIGADQEPNFAESASSEQAKFLLDTMDDMMRDLFPPEHFADFYESEIGGWDISPEEVPDWITEHFPVEAGEEDPCWIVETFRSFYASGTPADIDDPLDITRSGVGMITFSQKDNLHRVQIIVHGMHVPGLLEPHYWLEVRDSDREVRQLNDLDELPSAYEMEAEAMIRSLSEYVDMLSGRSAVTPTQALELEALLQHAWVRISHKG